MQKAFSRVLIDHVVAGNSRVSWELDRHFIDPGPYSFQLQVSHAGIVDAEWEDVGVPVIDTYFVIDTDKRLWGKTLDSHYRVQLTTSIDTYYSNPQDVEGKLSKRDWLFVREMTRKEQLRHRVLTSIDGFLLKARRYGPRCEECTDQYTEEVSSTNCQSCYGTGFENGYFPAMPACYGDIPGEQTRDHRNPNVGMEQQNVIKGRFIGDPQLYSYDVWVNGSSDERYYIHTVAVTAQHRGVPVVYEAELRLAPFSDVVYTIPLTGGTALMAKANRLQAKEKECLQDKEPSIQLNCLEAGLASIKGKRRRR